DQRIIDWISSEFKKSDGIDLSKDRMALQRLKEAAEKAKMELSTVMETDISLPFITADQTGPKHLAMRLSRAKFEQLVEDLLQKTVSPTRQALKDAGVDPSKIDEVVLVGGSTRIPRVQTIRRASKYTCCKVSGRWPAITARWVDSTWLVFLLRRAACRRSRSPSTSTPTGLLMSRRRILGPARSRRSRSRHRVV